MTKQPIKSLAELKKLASRPHGLECYLALNGGLRSSKFIRYCDLKNLGGKGKGFLIENLIDGTVLQLTAKQITDKNYTLIGDAIKQNTLIREN